MERLVEQAYTAFSEEARRRAIDYRRDVAAQPVIVTDGDRVLQIISNLLANAFRWTPDGGRIGLEPRPGERHRPGGGRRHGPGDHRGGARADLPAVRLAGRPAAPGLGLAIARELAAALGGRIDLESEPGRGSRFLLVLPASVADSRRWRPAALFDAVDDRAGARSAALLDPGEPFVDALPAGGDEVDEQRRGRRRARAARRAGRPRAARAGGSAGSVSPRTSASWRPTGVPRRATPSRTASPTRVGQRRLELAPRAAASASTCARARSSAASTSAGAVRPSAASASRSRARSIASSSMDGND